MPDKNKTAPAAVTAKTDAAMRQTKESIPIIKADDAIVKSEVFFADGYSVTPDGRVFSYKRKGRHELSGGYVTRDKRYRAVCLSINNISTSRYVHRLVAETFIANPDNLPEVNHIDGNPLNNHVDNLEWCTRSENVAHAYRTGLYRKRECFVCGKEMYIHSDICHSCKAAIRDTIISDMRTNNRIKSIKEDIAVIDPDYISKYADIFDMREQGLTLAEIGKKKGCTRQNVSFILCRGLALASGKELNHV